MVFNEYHPNRHFPIGAVALGARRQSRTVRRNVVAPTFFTVALFFSVVVTLPKLYKARA